MMKILGLLWRLMKTVFILGIVFPIIFCGLALLDALESICSPLVYAWEHTYERINWGRTWRHLRSGGVE